MTDLLETIITYGTRLRRIRLEPWVPWVPTYFVWPGCRDSSDTSTGCRESSVSSPIAGTLVCQTSVPVTGTLSTTIKKRKFQIFLLVSQIHCRCPVTFPLHFRYFPVELHVGYIWVTYAAIRNVYLAVTFSPLHISPMSVTEFSVELLSFPDHDTKRS